MRVWACLLAALMGIQAVERLRLADGPHGCAGRLEVWHAGRWGTVCDDGWDLRDAAVACRVLGCGGALAAPGGAFFGEGTGPVWLSELACRGAEIELGRCTHRGWRAHVCSHEEDAGVVCAGQRAADSGASVQSTSLLDVDPLPELFGSEETTSEPSVTHAPLQAGTPQNSARKKNPRPPKQIKSTRAPVLSSGAPRQERLRLVSGPHGCAGRLEVWHGGRWGTVCDDGWDLRDAAVACRELGCGGALAAPGGARFGPGSGPVWMDDVGCGGSEQALRDCPRSPWGRSNCDHSEDAGLVCSGPAPRLRLADGPHGCAGRLEVFHAGRWGTVCDDGWDLRDAAVACRALGCGGALAAPGGAFFGEGPGPVLLDDLRCRGNESALSLCPSRPWGQHDCHHREDAGAVCDGMPLPDVLPTAPAGHSNSSTSRMSPATPSLTPGTRPPPPTSPTEPWDPAPEAGSPALRLVAGPSRCAGRLEVWHAGRWGTVCDDAWDPQDAAVACRELGCGAVQPLDPEAGRFGWGSGPIWLDDVACVGTEVSLADCPASPWGKHNCAHNEDVGLICMGSPGLDSLSDPFSWSWGPGDPDAWVPAETVTPQPARLATSVTTQKATRAATGKMPKSPKKWANRSTKRPATKSPRVAGTQGDPALTSQATTSPPRASPTSTAQTATSWDPTATQDPRDATSEGATQRSPPTTPAGAPSQDPSSPEAPQDPSLAPTAGDSGPFRVRLADGPNRCAGRLEVRRAGRWGTVCDDGWDLRDAAVACRELGCGRVRPRVGKTHYGPGAGPIWLDDVACRGAEGSLSLCPARPWGQHDCGHEEDVGLTCTGHADADDYPPWTWDPTSGEDLAKGTTAAGLPGNTLPWSSTPPAPTRRLPGTDKENYESSWMWDTLSGGTLAQGTPTSRTRTTTAVSTTSSPSRRSLVPRARGDPAGAAATAQPPRERRTQRPTGTPTATPSSASAASPGPSEPQGGVQASSSRGGTSDLPDPSPTAPAAAGPEMTPKKVLQETTSDPSTPGTGTGRTPTSAVTPESGAAPLLATRPEPPRTSDPASTGQPHTTPPQPPTDTPQALTDSPDRFTHHALTDSPHPLNDTPRPFNTTPHPLTNALHPLSDSPHSSTMIPENPTMTSSPLASTYPHASSPQAPTMSPQPPTLHSTVTLGPTPSAPVTSLGTQRPASALTVQHLGVPGQTSTETPDPSTPRSPEPTLDPRSTLQPTKGPRVATLSPPAAQTPPATSVPQGDPLSPPPHHHPLASSPEEAEVPLSPCVAPTPPVRVMACEPPALVELVAAVRDVGDQLRRLSQALEQDQQERRALNQGLARMVEAAQGLSQLGEAVRRLAEGALHPSTPQSVTATPEEEEEEERPLRGDV